MKTWVKKLASWTPPAARRWLRRAYYVRVVMTFSEHRWPESTVVKRLVEPGDRVVDVGANVGYITALLARWVGPEGHVDSVEPVPETFDLLRYSARKLRWSNVRLHACAASDHEGEAAIYVPTDASGIENFYESSMVGRGKPKGPGRRLSVRTATLDSMLSPPGDRLSFIKIDVEGHERAALHGAHRILREARPALLIEVSGDPNVEGSAAHDLFQWLMAQGYGVYSFIDGELRPRSSRVATVDYFFLTDEQHARALGDGEPAA